MVVVVGGTCPLPFTFYYREGVDQPQSCIFLDDFAQSHDSPEAQQVYGINLFAKVGGDLICRLLFQIPQT
jgi:hypothetical protein